MLLDNVSSIVKYIGVDVLPGYKFGLPIQERELPPNPGELLRGDKRYSNLLSARGAWDINANTIGEFDMVLIDGDHSRAAVENDSALADKIVRPRGLIVWHDYGDWCVDVNEALAARAANGHVIHHAADTMLAWEFK